MHNIWLTVLSKVIYNWDKNGQLKVKGVTDRPNHGSLAVLRFKLTTLITMPPPLLDADTHTCVLNILL